MNIDYLNELRLYEIGAVLERYGSLIRGRRVLDVGSGTGVQLAELSKVAEKAVGIDLPDGTYEANADDSVVPYDGRHIPFPDGYFDVVFSSNVLEHIRHRDEFQDEIRRVLKDGGHCIHLLPTHYWKLWHALGTMLVGPVRLGGAALQSIRTGRWCLPRTLSRWIDLSFCDKHGEFGNRVTEFFHFMPSRWRSYFASRGWEIVEVRPGGLAYEGNMIFAHLIRWRSDSPFVAKIRRSHWRAREILSNVFGSACYVYVLRKAG